MNIPGFTAEAALKGAHRYSRADVGAITGTEATVWPAKILSGVCQYDQSYSCQDAYDTCLYYGRTLGDPGDESDCCHWWNSHCIAPPPYQGGNGGGGEVGGPRHRGRAAQ